MSKPDDQARMPRQIPFIIANEGCERLSFYGMRNILTPFLTTMLLVTAFPDKGLREGAAKEVFHTFVMGVYFFPLLGGWLADRFFGKYNTILWFSLIYCAGNACLATAGRSIGQFYLGLFLISLGSGGIKPLVASFMGDQFDSRTKHLAKLVFDAFYWIINFGSFFASLLMPIFLAQLGPRWAFGIPGALMFVATVVFWLGRRRYVMMPVAPPNPHSFLRVVRTAGRRPDRRRAASLTPARGPQCTATSGTNAGKPARSAFTSRLSTPCWHAGGRRSACRRRPGSTCHCAARVSTWCGSPNVATPWWAAN